MLFALASITIPSRYRLVSVAAAGLLLAAATYLESFLAGSPVLIALFLVAITFGALLLLRYRFLILLVMMSNLLVMIAGYTDGGYERSLFILVGVLLVACLEWLLLPRKKAELDKWVHITLRHLNELTKEIFTCFLSDSYPKHIYLFEHRLHQQKSKCLQSLLTLRTLWRREEKSREIGEKMDLLYDITMDLAGLRFRVADHTTYNVCDEELKAVAKTIEENYHCLALQKPWQGNIRMDEKIKSFEANYQNVLQVAAREPLVFLFFIASLKSLSEGMNDLSQLLCQ